MARSLVTIGLTSESFPLMRHTAPHVFSLELGALMHDPVSTPDGYLFERAALEDMPGSLAQSSCEHVDVPWRTGPVSTARTPSLAPHWFGPYLSRTCPDFTWRGGSACCSPQAMDEVVDREDIANFIQAR